MRTCQGHRNAKASKGDTCESPSSNKISISSSTPFLHYLVVVLHQIWKKFPNTSLLSLSTNLGVLIFGLWRMVQLMKNGESASQTEKVAAVKMEVEDALEDEHGPFHKRTKVFICYLIWFFWVYFFYFGLLCCLETQSNISEMSSQIIGV